MKQEYLVLLSKDDSFCNKVDDIIKFINIDPLIKIKQNVLTFQKEQNLEYKFSIIFEISKKPSHEDRFFIVSLENEYDVNIDIFVEIGDKIKWLLKKIQPNNNTLTILWDDVGRYYAEKAYPLINKIENLMRKLISKFMLINVGVEWTKTSIHPELIKKIESFNEDEEYSNDLHKLDFIHLSEILFKKKRDISLEELDRILLKNKLEKYDISRIKRIIPKSNWEKYFSSLLGEKTDKLEKKWKILYKFRNNVAHNRFIKAKEFAEIEGLVNDVENILNDAIKKLDKITLDEAQKNEILSSFMTNSRDSLDGRTKTSLIKYFDKMGFEMTTPSEEKIQWDIDFILNMNNISSILEVKVLKSNISFGPLYMYLWRLVKKIRAIMESEDLKTAYLIIIVNDDNIIEYIKQMISEFSSLELVNIEIILGGLNLDQEFVPLINYSFIRDSIGFN